MSEDRYRQLTAAPALAPTSSSDKMLVSREAYERWQLSRHVAMLECNSIGTWGDEAGENYAAPFVQAGWEAWQAALRSELEGRE